MKIFTRQLIASAIALLLFGAPAIEARGRASRGGSRSSVNRGGGHNSNRNVNRNVNRNINVNGGCPEFR